MPVRLRDVAKHAQVSVATVSNVLNWPDRVAPDTVLRVQTAINELGFVRNDIARQLRAGRSRSIGLVVLDIRNPFFTDLARGGEKRASQENLTILLGDSDEDPDREAAHLDLFEEQQVYGVLVSPLSEASPRLAQLRQNGVPTVLVGRTAENHNFSSVSVNDVYGGQIAATHLAETGRRRIAFMGPLHLRQVADRLAGAGSALEHLPNVSLEVIHTKSLATHEGRAAVDRLLERRPHDRPDAIFAANDQLATGALHALAMSESVDVPRDIAVIGYDDIDFAPAAIVPLSSIRQPSARMGFEAVDLLIREVIGSPDFTPQQVVFQPELIVRASSLPSY